uniref:Putative secreted peptide n=1 Tax=Anopheles braziliensis TaxID=58242 RepID=A0A2M3ZMP1_9DIPT
MMMVVVVVVVIIVVQAIVQPVTLLRHCPVEYVADPTVTMADDRIVPVLHTVHHCLTVLIAEPSQPLPDRFIARFRIAFQCPDGVVYLPLQEIDERTVKWFDENRFPQFAHDLGVLAR